MFKNIPRPFIFILTCVLQTVSLWLASTNPCGIELKFGILYGCYDTGIGQYWGWLLLVAYMLPLIVWFVLLPNFRAKWFGSILIYFGVLWGSWWYYTASTVDELHRTRGSLIVHSIIGQIIAFLCISLYVRPRADRPVGPT
jgi:hypothetical protein